ncbi:MAG TPA: hypothetical protein VM681_04260 [Candidatus Thermoplasmatota archaeon]|nr:hypothetical protein [Candidatus Thermoplasmatota archaeon]
MTTGLILAGGALACHPQKPTPHGQQTECSVGEPGNGNSTDGGTDGGSSDPGEDSGSNASGDDAQSPADETPGPTDDGNDSPPEEPASDPADEPSEETEPSGSGSQPSAPSSSAAPSPPPSSGPSSPSPSSPDPSNASSSDPGEGSNATQHESSSDPASGDAQGTDDGSTQPSLTIDVLPPEGALRQTVAQTIVGDGTLTFQIPDLGFAPAWIGYALDGRSFVATEEEVVALRVRLVDVSTGPHLLEIAVPRAEGGDPVRIEVRFSYLRVDPVVADLEQHTLGERSAATQSTGFLPPVPPEAPLLALAALAAVLAYRRVSATRAPRVSSDEEPREGRCELCLGRFKLQAPRSECSCGLAFHHSCLSRSGTCPGCGALAPAAPEAPSDGDVEAAA